MQDLLVYVTKGISAVTTQLRSEGKEIDDNVNHQIIVNLFTTITNANFDKESIITRIKETLEIKEELLKKSKTEMVSRKLHSGTVQKILLKIKLRA